MIYLIISALKLSELEYKVNDHIKAGYIPSGGIAIDSDGTFHQSMLHPQKLLKAGE